MEWNVMEFKVWFEGKTINETLKSYWKFSLYGQKINKKKALVADIQRSVGCSSCGYFS